MLADRAAPGERLATAFRSVADHPATGPAVLLVLLVATIDLGRYPEWDEAVFLTQTSGIDGAPAPPSFLGPSREIGSVWKLWILSLISPEYPNLRLLHAVLVIASLGLVSGTLARATGVPRAVLTIGLGAWWVTFLNIGALLRFSLLASVVLGIVALVAELLTTDVVPSARRLVGLGGLIVLGGTIGPFETAVTMLGAGSYWAVARPAWRDPRTVGWVGGTAVVGGAVVFALDTLPQYGSLAARVDALRQLEGPTGTSRLDWAALNDYARQVVAGPVWQERLAPDGWVPQIAYLGGAVLFIIGGGVAVRWVTRLVMRRDRDHLVGVSTVVAALFVLFLGGYYALQVDRYLIVPGSIVLLLGMIGCRDLLHSDRLHRLVSPLHRVPRLARTSPTVAVAAALAVFAATNVHVASSIDEALSESGDGAMARFRLAREMADGRDCTVVARFNLPAAQWASGCQAARATTNDALLTVVDAIPPDRVVFVYWSWRLAEDDPTVVDELSRRGLHPVAGVSASPGDPWELWAPG